MKKRDLDLSLGRNQSYWSEGIILDNNDVGFQCREICHICDSVITKDLPAAIPTVNNLKNQPLKTGV